MAKIQTISLEERTYFLGYKVVTEDLKSLGLRKNLNILTYPINKWYTLPKNQVSYGPGDWGGIWVVRLLSTAKKLQDYMSKGHNTKTRIFKACLDEILYSNSYRIKTTGIKMFEEVY